MDDPIEIIAISKFKATCAAVLQRVRRTGKRVRVTRFGEPVADIVPPVPTACSADWLGSMRESAQIVGDILAPVAANDEWEVVRRPKGGTRTDPAT